MTSISFEPFAKTLNKWDVYPVISTLYSAPVRSVVGVAQIVSGLAFALLFSAFGWIDRPASSWLNAISMNFKEVGHGIGNLFRSAIAVCPLVGNLTIYLYEKASSGSTSSVEPLIIQIHYNKKPVMTLTIKSDS